MNALNEVRPKPVPFRLVASATPSDRELDGLSAADRDMFLKLREDTRTRIDQTLARYHTTPPHIFHDIPEIVWLKWKETITVFSPDQVSEYEKLAQKLIEQEAGQPANA